MHIVNSNLTQHVFIVTLHAGLIKISLWMKKNWIKKVITSEKLNHIYLLIELLRNDISEKWYIGYLVNMIFKNLYVKWNNDKSISEFNYWLLQLSYF